MLVNLDDYITSSHFFKWREALLLPTWGIYHSPSAQEIENIKATCLKLDKFRSLVGKPFNIHCWIRPNKTNDPTGKYQGQDYNALKKGAKKSSHISGLAVDFHAVGLNIDELMKIIQPRLSEYQMAAENNSIKNGRTWCHLQNKILSDGTWRVYNP
jgi:hypothetical protein